MKKITLLFSLAAFSTGLFAQDNAAKLALAREVISAVQADKMIDGMLAQMKQMAAQSTALPPDATPEQKVKAQELQSAILDLTMTSAKKMITQMDQIYADVYSESDLTAMKAFFTSAAGRSMTEKQPLLMQRMMPLMMQMQKELKPQIQALMQGAKAP